MSFSTKELASFLKSHKARDFFAEEVIYHAENHGEAMGEEGRVYLS